jgi:predicted Zn-dependent protease with MMP-like domain
MFHDVHASASPANRLTSRPTPMHVTQQKFDEIVRRAIRRIPREIRTHLDNLVICIEQRPSRKLLKEMAVPHDETLLGVYLGDPLTERLATAPPLQPDRIVLFQEPIEDCCDTAKDMEREIAITVVHEIAHAFGISEERLAELGYD